VKINPDDAVSGTHWALKVSNRKMTATAKRIAFFVSLAILGAFWSVTLDGYFVRPEPTTTVSTSSRTEMVTSTVKGVGQSTWRWNSTPPVPPSGL